MDNKLKKILSEVLEIDEAKIDKSYELDAENNWDSLAVLSAISMIDDEYSIELDGDDIALCETASELQDLIIANS